MHTIAKFLLTCLTQLSIAGQQTGSGAFPGRRLATFLSKMTVALDVAHDVCHCDFAGGPTTYGGLEHPMARLPGSLHERSFPSTAANSLQLQDAARYSEALTALKALTGSTLQLVVAVPAVQALLPMLAALAGLQRLRLADKRSALGHDLPKDCAQQIMTQVRWFPNRHARRICANRLTSWRRPRCNMGGLL
jgi:hypothetical protein